MVNWAWNIDLVKAPAALDLLPKTAAGRVDWGDIKLCHLDTGFTEHRVFRDPLSGETWLRPDEGRNFIESGPPVDPLDDKQRRGKSYGHGPRTGSVICGGADLRPDGTLLDIGVAPGLPLVPCRVVTWVVLLDSGSRERVAAGIRHAIQRGCQVVSMSLGGLGGNKAMFQAVTEAYNRGIILVAAAGQETDRVTFPGRYKRTITCAAVDRHKVPWRNQYWEKHPHEAAMIDVWAPGVDVPVVTLPPEGAGAGTAGSSLGSTSASSEDSSASKGSSYSTAHVAAAAAMWLRHREAEIAAYPKPWQRVEAFRTLLKTSKGALSGLLPPNGTGLLDIEKLLKTPLPAAADLG
jgi:subtilisin family serine protease